MAWRCPGDKPLSEPMQLVYWRIYASLSINELKVKDIYMLCVDHAWFAYINCTSTQKLYLSHCGLVTPYGDIDLIEILSGIL